MGKWLLTSATILVLFGAIIQSLDFFNLIPDTLGYSLLLMSAVILAPWLPPILLFFNFYDSLGTKKSKWTQFAITLLVIILVYAVFLNPLMPWFSNGHYPYLGSIGFIFPFVASATFLFLVKGLYFDGTKSGLTGSS